MIYEFKSKLVKNLNEQQENYINIKKDKYSFKNKSRIEPYILAKAVDSASQETIKHAIQFAGLVELMD
jgi:hypothetical protein